MIALNLYHAHGKIDLVIILMHFGSNNDAGHDAIDRSILKKATDQSGNTLSYSELDENLKTKYIAYKLVYIANQGKRISAIKPPMYAPRS